MDFQMVLFLEGQGFVSTVKSHESGRKKRGLFLKNHKL